MNWGTATLSVLVEIVGGTPPLPGVVSAVVPGRSVSGFAIPDSGTPRGWTYSDTQFVRGAGPEEIAVGRR